MPELHTYLDLPKCPHCNVDKPNLTNLYYYESANYDKTLHRHWRVYCCARCGGLVTAWAHEGDGWVVEVFPQEIQVDNAIPNPANKYLQQALDSLHAPAGAVMLAASAIDAMLKKKSYKEGSLYTRINKAADDHLITPEMAQWAHNVRLDANEQRHADDEAELPTEADARRSIDFALALAEFLFVLPSRVNKGLRESELPMPEEPKPETLS